MHLDRQVVKDAIQTPLSTRTKFENKPQVFDHQTIFKESCSTGESYNLN
jgi:hypothetical protein